jgi:acyl-[acyl-carrier-protein]-phospholipid O-acyltransferase/long-chain-fatty-acid--[acyl-carrier-protein] ligase
MNSGTPEAEPSKRQWVGYWSMIVQQTQNAFNDKAAQFILVPLGGAVGYAVESWAGLMIALPFVLFAPLAGWFSDRFSKRNVIIGAAIAQVGILCFIALGVFLKQMPLVLLGFFLLAVQSAFFSPAKIGINKELVGSRHLGFAAGVQQMMAMLAILAGQIVAGWWYDKRYIALGSDSKFAWEAAFFPLVVLCFCAVPAVLMAISIPRVPAYGRERLNARLLFSHFKDLKELWREPGLRRASFGVAFFWGFAAFINLWSVKVAKTLTDGGQGFGTLSSIYMAAASLGMVFGFGFASWLLRKRIELGWVPVGGFAMTFSAILLVFVAAGSWMFLIGLGLLAFSSALFLAPLNAWMQDHYPANKRGELQSAVNLQDCFAGIAAVIAIELMIFLFGLLGFSAMEGFRLQLVVIAISCALISWYVLRILPADFIRLIVNAAMRGLYRIKFTGSEHIPRTGGALLLPNHVTFADAFFISAASERPVRFVMDENFMASRLIRLAAKLFGTVTIRRDQPLVAIRTTIQALDEGYLVVLFPEGQLSRTGGLGEIERGFELIARKANVPLYPVWVDGSWGSIFSFERGRFFRKTPYRIPYGLSIAVGRQIPSTRPDRALMQTSLMKASAEAVDRRLLGNTDALDRNAHQLTQSAALPRGATVHVLASEETDLEVLEVFKRFTRQTGGKWISQPDFSPADGNRWIGGEKLRKQIEASEAVSGEMWFYDFSDQAKHALEKPGIVHLPCLAISGQVISMSMPHPPLPIPTSQFQPGNKPGSLGKVLSGWYVENGKFQPGELPLPEDFNLDQAGFIVPEAISSSVGLASD